MSTKQEGKGEHVCKNTKHQNKYTGNDGSVCGVSKKKKKKKKRLTFHPFG